MPKASKNTPGSSAAGKERPIHPYSRKALKLNKQQIHEKKLEGAKSNTKVKTELIAEKVKWFQDNLDDRHLYTKQDMIDLVMEYRNRFAEELEQINIVQAVGNRQTQSRQHASREAAIKITMEEETHQFEGSGMEVPDLINKKHLDDLRKWNGDLNQIQNLKFRKISALDIRRLEQKSEDNKS
ncbi:translation machinery-associated protein 16 [Plakobranchus ocellatus]|uniref:Translation machinery-associated protein 16 n=1 Tax=Plakobranchus ocellatus TaxID=259542 RepID=A0AAV4D220_9GAST|nr:translation machinery-associated protein 16 [Plakobranchus ocellatus]